jgi:hypothetical protein
MGIAKEQKRGFQTCHHSVLALFTLPTPVGRSGAGAAEAGDTADMRFSKLCADCERIGRREDGVTVPASLMDTGAGSGDGERAFPMGAGAGGSAALGWGGPTFLCGGPGKETSAEAERPCLSRDSRGFLWTDDKVD